MLTSTSRETEEYTLPPEQPSEIRPAPSVPVKVQAELAALSHQGKVRTNNEDHYLVMRFERVLEAMMTNLPPGLIPTRYTEGGYGMLVADGMGGQASGEVASRLAIQTLINLFLESPYWIIRAGEQEIEQVMQRMGERFKIVDAAVREQAEADPSLAGMGTTMTMAFNLGAVLVLAHIGDSRVYLYRDGHCHQLTRDHTLAQGLVELGAIRPDEAAGHRLKHALTRAIGGSKHIADAEVQHLNLADGDQVLLCTDGLSDMVTLPAIATILGAAKSPNDACQALVDKALENGGRDNVTVVTARYRLISESA
jgi:protein phosphatase